MAHSYQLVWHDYFPDETKFEFFRNEEEIVRSSGQYFIYFSLFKNIENRVSVKISSQNTATKVLIHTNIFDNCSSNENTVTSSCVFLTGSGHIIINKVFCKSCSANNANGSGQSITLDCSKTDLFLSSICFCKGTGDFSPVLKINSDSKIYSLNETNNQCKDESAFRILSNSIFKYSIAASNSATRTRILYWGLGSQSYYQNMIFNNSEKMQGIALNEANSDLTISKCSFVNNKGNSIFYAHSYFSTVTSMTIVDCSLIFNEVGQTFKSDTGMTLNIESIGDISFQVFVKVLSDFETLPPFSDYEITCNKIYRNQINFFLLFPIVLLYI